MAVAEDLEVSTSVVPPFERPFDDDRLTLATLDQHENASVGTVGQLEMGDIDTTRRAAPHRTSDAQRRGSGLTERGGWLEPPAGYAVRSLVMIVVLGIDKGSDHRLKWLGDLVEWLDSTLGPAHCDSALEGRDNERTDPLRIRLANPMPRERIGEHAAPLLVRLSRGGKRGSNGAVIWTFDSNSQHRAPSPTLGAHHQLATHLDEDP